MIFFLQTIRHNFLRIGKTFCETILIVVVELVTFQLWNWSTNTLQCVFVFFVNWKIGMPNWEYVLFGTLSFTNTHTHSLYHTHTLFHTHSFTHTHSDTHTHTHTYTHIHSHTLTHTHLHSFTHTHIHTHTLIHTYTQIHTHTHIYSRMSF